MNYRLYLFLMLVLINLIIPDRIKADDNLLNYPQMIVIDYKRNLLLASNEGNGALVKIDSAGNQTYFKYRDSNEVERHTGFIDGIAMVGDTIYGVGSGRKLYGYNLETRRQVMNIKIPGSTSNYLSSVTYDSAGHLFISCPPLHEIYKLRISDKTNQIFADASDSLIWPNGMLLEREKNRLVVIGDAQSNAKIFSVGLLDSLVDDIMQTNLSSPDGIVKDKFGSYYIGGYSLPGLLKIDSAFEQSPTLYYQGPYPHIIYPTYDPRDNSILVTYYLNKAWGRIDLNTGIGDEMQKEKKPLLCQNYPNPFNNSTSISYYVPDGGGAVTLTVYNLKGEVVGTLVNNQILPAGFYSASFIADRLSSGVYNCVYSYGNQQKDIRKIVLLK